MKYALDFLDVDIRPGKPRSNGLTIVRDRVRGLAEQQSFLETYAPFVDFAKISNLSPRFYPEELIFRKIALYRDFDVQPFFGGIVFENAYAQDRLEAFYDYLPGSGVTAIELSDNIVSMPQVDMLCAIERCCALDITVFVEWGEKYPTYPLDPDKAETEIRARLASGASKIVIERAEIDLLCSNDAEAWRLDQLIAQDFSPQIILEVESQPQMVWAIQRYGPDVNLGPNIDFELVKWLEPARAGVGRDVGHRTIENKAGSGGVHSRLEPSTGKSGH